MFIFSCLQYFQAFTVMMYTKRDLTMCVGRATPGRHRRPRNKDQLRTDFQSNTSFCRRNYKLVQSKV
jgi:hypothetical protein